MLAPPPLPGSYSFSILLGEGLGSRREVSLEAGGLTLESPGGSNEPPPGFSRLV